MGKEMKAWFYYGPKDIRLKEVTVPKFAAGELLVKVDVALTCGTDLKAFLRGHPHFHPPVRLGHEFCGTVVEKGENVCGIDIGDRIVALPLAWCQECHYCRIGLPTQCTRKTRMMGAYAEYLRIPAATVRSATRVLPREMSSQTAALTEPLSVAVHGLEAAGINVGDTVAVNGAGPIGLLLAWLCLQAGARVIVCDPVSERLESARIIGVDDVVLVTEAVDQAQAVKNLTWDEQGADVVIEAVGLPQVWEKTVQMVRPGGTAILFGGCPEGTVFSVATGKIHYDEVTIKGVYYCGPKHFTRAFDLLAKDIVPSSSLITDELRLTELPEALERMRKRESLKIALHPS